MSKTRYKFFVTVILLNIINAAIGILYAYEPLADFHKNNLTLIYLITMLLFAVMWVLTLSYFRKRELKFAFYNYIIFGLANLAILVTMLLEEKGIYQKSATVFLITSLPFILSYTTMNFHLAFSKKTIGLKFLRLFGLLGIVQIILNFYFSFAGYEKSFADSMSLITQIPPLVAFAIHLRNEREIMVNEIENNEILDN